MISPSDYHTRGPGQDHASGCVCVCVLLTATLHLNMVQVVLVGSWAIHSRPQPGPCRHPYSFQALLSVSRGHPSFGERASSGAQERSGLPSGPPTSQQGGRVCHPGMVCGFQQLHLFLSLQEAPRQHPETSTQPQGRPLQARLGNCPDGALLRFPTLESR